MKKRDLILVAAVLVLSAALYFLQGGADSVTVKKDGEIVGSFFLGEDRAVDIGGTNTLVIENGEAYMKSATCPDKLCIRQGKIGKKGGSIVCLPNKVAVESNSGFDAVSR